MNYTIFYLIVLLSIEILLLFIAMYLGLFVIMLKCFKNCSIRLMKVTIIVFFIYCIIIVLFNTSILIINT